MTSSFAADYARLPAGRHPRPGVPLPALHGRRVGASIGRRQGSLLLRSGNNGSLRGLGCEFSATTWKTRNFAFKTRYMIIDLSFISLDYVIPVGTQHPRQVLGSGLGPLPRRLPRQGAGQGRKRVRHSTGRLGTGEAPTDRQGIAAGLVANSCLKCSFTVMAEWRRHTTHELAASPHAGDLWTGAR